MIEKEKKNRCFEDVQKWIKGLSDGTYGNQIETSTTKGLRLVKAHKGFLLCDMIIHTGLLVIKHSSLCFILSLFFGYVMSESITVMAFVSIG